ncbi:MAG: T9SS type A sorting domain-containing protein [Chitinophagales bacterium]|nr:T9SS type A sorting domain-containing protein [Chitinophagales bacterium]
MKNKCIVSFFLLFAIAQNTSAQFINFYKPAGYEIAEAPQWAQKMYSDDPNVYEVDQLYNVYYETHLFEKNYHTQYYKRWRRFVAPFINENGFVVLPEVAEFNQQINTILEKRTSSSASRSSGGDWENIGPYQTYNADAGYSNDQTNVYSIDQSLSDPDILYCGTEPGEIYKSINGGASWEGVTNPYYFAGVEAIEIDPADPDIVYAANGWNVYKTSDGGTTWSTVLSLTSLWPHEILVNPSNTNIVLVAADAGLFRSEDAGVTWNTLYEDNCWDIKLKPGDDDIVYLLKNNPLEKRSEFFISDNMGATFILKDNGWYSSADAERYDGGARLAVTPADPNRIYVYLIGGSKSGDYGYIGIYRSDDGGETWYLPNGPDGSPYDSDHQNLAIGWVGWNYHQGFYNCAIMTSNDDADKILIGGLNLWKSDDGGYTFEPLGGYIADELDMHPDMQDFRATENGYWITSDGGVNFSYDFFVSDNQRRSAGIHGADYWGFGQGWNQDIFVGGLYHNGNLAYYENYGDGNFLQLGGAEPASGYVNPGNNLKVYSSDIGAVIIPESIGEPIQWGSLGLAPNESYWSAWSSEMEFDPRCYNICFLGNENKLWRSTDGATSFNVLYTFGTNVNAKVLYFEIARSNPAVMYVAQAPASGSLGDLWKTTDGGITFTELSIPPASGYRDRILLALDPENENNLYLAYPGANDGNKIFHSDDGGISWINITSDMLNGEEVRSIFYAGATDGGVYYCTNYSVYYYNNTIGWAEFSDGLPFYANTDISKPFYRDGKIRLATYGKGIWQSDLYEEPAHPVCQPMVDKLNTYCASDTFYFEDYSIINHEGATWGWVFEGGTPSSSAVRNPKVIFDGTGSHEVTLTVTDINGNASTGSLIITIDEIDQTEIAETFEDIFPPAYWTTTGINAGTGIWNKTTDAGGYDESSSSALANNYWYDLQGAYGDLRAFINLSAVTSPELFYDVAYAQYSDAYSDTLVILISMDCGETFTELYRSGGDDLSTAPDYTADIFYPDASEWRTDSLDLSIAAGAENVQIIFRNIGRWGQALYIDNVNVKGFTVGVGNTIAVKGVNIYPNPVASGNAITLSGNPEKQFSLEIFDATGKMVLKENISTGQSILLDKKIFSAGLYTFKLEGEEYMRFGKLIVM